MGKKSKIRKVIEETEKEIETLKSNIALLEKLLEKLKAGDK